MIAAGVRCQRNYPVLAIPITTDHHHLDSAGPGPLVLLRCRICRYGGSKEPWECGNKELLFPVRGGGIRIDGRGGSFWEDEDCME